MSLCVADCSPSCWLYRIDATADFLNPSSHGCLNCVNYFHYQTPMYTSVSTHLDVAHSLPGTMSLCVADCSPSCWLYRIDATADFLNPSSHGCLNCVNYFHYQTPMYTSVATHLDIAHSLLVHHLSPLSRGSVEGTRVPPFIYSCLTKSFRLTCCTFWPFSAGFSSFFLLII